MTYDLVGSIIAYESGDLDMVGIVKLFSALVKSGQAWTLQGSYGRMAKALIDAEILGSYGSINWAHGALAEFDPSDTNGPEQEDEGDPEFWCSNCEAEELSRCVCGIQEIEIPSSEY